VREYSIQGMVLKNKAVEAQATVVRFARSNTITRDCLGPM